MITKETNQKVFLLDAYALIYRAYFAFSKNPRINSKGQNTSAAFGFTNTLIEILKNEKPSHIAVVFDPPGGSTERQETFIDYKANREEMPEDLRSMIDPIKQIIEAFRIPVIEVIGYEADDVIGTLAIELEKKDYLVYMMTPDKDFGQLVSEKIKIYKPGRGGAPAQVLGIKEVCEKFEVSQPKQVIDILGLWGDASDNIPGIPGIGEKTSKILIQKYESVENLIANAQQLKGKQKENVINFSDQGLLSKKLATIDCEVPVSFSEDQLCIKPLDQKKIKEVFEILEFRNLYKRLFDEELNSEATKKQATQLDLFGSQSMLEKQEKEETSGLKTLTTEKAKYHLVDSVVETKKLIDILLEQKKICFDTETTSIEGRHAKLIGISFSFKTGEAYYVPIPQKKEDAMIKLEKFTRLFNSDKILKIAHNLKYDFQVLSNYNIHVSEPTFDTMIAGYLINPDFKLNMDFLAEKLLNYKTIPISSLIGPKGKTQKSMADLSPKEIKDYACEDADITLQIMQKLEEEINKPHLRDLFFKIEMPLVEVLSNMENEGICIDKESLKVFSFELDEQLKALNTIIKELAGVNFNIDSPKQLGEVLFDHMKISSKAKKTKTGQYATSEEVLQKMKNNHPIIPELLLYRQLRKLKNTYVDPLPELCDKKTGRIHTHFMQTVTSTGRLSSTNPNLQNIPIRSAKGREIRKSFISRGPDYSLMAADYSQIELRIMAALSKDKNMIEAFVKDRDIHTETAAKVFKVPIENVSRDQRSSAKAVNFGIIYGQSAFGLSQNLNISRKEAKEIIENYFIQYPNIKEYMEKVVFDAREKGYVETLFKRRRYLPDINSSNAIVRGYAERNAINAPIQGSAADIIKIAMVEVHGEMKRKKLKSKLILQVHDELVFDVHKSEQELMTNMVIQKMEKSAKLNVPMKVDYKISTNWLDAH